MPPEAEPDLETLRLVYADIVRERDRLRDARRAVTARLGPLPASAGLIVGLFAGLAPIEGTRATVLLAVALAVFFLLTAISIVASRLPPYRSSRETLEGLTPEDSQSEQAWLTQMIGRERAIYAGPLRTNFNREWLALVAVQFLLFVEVLLLVLLKIVT